MHLLTLLETQWAQTRPAHATADAFIAFGLRYLQQNPVTHVTHELYGPVLVLRDGSRVALFQDEAAGEMQYAGPVHSVTVLQGGGNVQHPSDVIPIHTSKPNS